MRSLRISVRRPKQRTPRYPAELMVPNRTPCGSAFQHNEPLISLAPPATARSRLPWKNLSFNGIISVGIFAALISSSAGQAANMDRADIAASGIATTVAVLNVPEDAAFPGVVRETEKSIVADAVRVWSLPAVASMQDSRGANVRIARACPDHDRLVVVSWRLGVLLSHDVGNIVQRLQVFDIDCRQQLIRHAVEASSGGAYNPRFLPPFSDESEAQFRKQQLSLVRDLVERMHDAADLNVPLPLIDLLNYT